MSTSDCNPKGCSIVGHGVLVALYVSRGGERGSGAAACVLEDGTDA